MSAARTAKGVAGARRSPVPLCHVRTSDVGARRDDFPGHAHAVDDVVPGHVVVTSQKTGVSALGLQRVLGLRSYKTAWSWLHKLRRAMVRPGRDRLRGYVEVDEAYLGSIRAGWAGRRKPKPSWSLPWNWITLASGAFGCAAFPMRQRGA